MGSPASKERISLRSHRGGIGGGTLAIVFALAFAFGAFALFGSSGQVSASGNDYLCNHNSVSERGQELLKRVCEGDYTKGDKDDEGDKPDDHCGSYGSYSTTSSKCDEEDDHGCNNGPFSFGSSSYKGKDCEQPEEPACHQNGLMSSVHSDGCEEPDPCDTQTVTYSNKSKDCEEPEEPGCDNRPSLMSTTYGHKDECEEPEEPDCDHPMLSTSTYGHDKDECPDPDPDPCDDFHRSGMTWEDWKKLCQPDPCDNFHTSGMTWADWKKLCDPDPCDSFETSGMTLHDWKKLCDPDPCDDFETSGMSWEDWKHKCDFDPCDDFHHSHMDWDEWKHKCDVDVCDSWHPDHISWEDWAKNCGVNPCVDYTYYHTHANCRPTVLVPVVQPVAQQPQPAAVAANAGATFSPPRSGEIGYDGSLDAPVAVPLEAPLTEESMAGSTALGLGLLGLSAAGLAGRLTLHRSKR